ncbi:YajG family lipoprotein [Psychromonas sp. PT13]|uniref:YajG family lipoprotein n=1 Tax=Psychromonas sp. PT13 TaxID=3439547 RepID=UPI003EB8509B
MIYLSIKKMTQALLLTSSFLLVACSTSPLSITLQPTLSEIPANSVSTSKLNWQITSQDFRTAQYLIIVSEGDGVATLINDAQNSRLVIQQSLQQKWAETGLRLNPQSENKITIQLIELLSKVKQTSFSHTVNSTITINVRVESGTTVFNKIFASNTEQEAPLSVNIKKTGNKLNTQLSLLLDEIINDPELNAKFK